jgi:bifunctional UDP-N-acetylglucosamine pyrophosphorylase/glucosamine-1-phosphate N-acetyltransferase
MKTSVVILAAGEGTRMSSNLPKAMQFLAGKTMLEHVKDTTDNLSCEQTIVVYSPGAEKHITKRLGKPNQRLLYVQQKEPLGTGHALKCSLSKIKQDNVVLVLLSDVPLVRPKTLQQLVESAAANTLTLLTANINEPKGYGRIIRNANNEIIAILEDDECSAKQKNINEINSGIMAFPPNKINQWLNRLSANNKKGEYYLTDTIEFAVDDGLLVDSIQPQEIEEIFGVNNKKQLAEAEKIKRKQAADRLLQAGVSLADPARIDVRGELVCGKDVFIDVNVVFEGKVVVSDGVSIGPHSIIANSTIGKDTTILSHCNLEDANVGDNCSVGPFARLRPGTEMMDSAKVGNFVEIKKSQIGQGSKVSHLSYIGDAELGDEVNIGAGTITCNYDGANKHQTIIEDNVFIGSGVELVAPIAVKEGATIGAGSTITKEAPKNKLTLQRAPQKTVPSWKRPKKNTT